MGRQVRAQKQALNKQLFCCLIDIYSIYIPQMKRRQIIQMPQLQSLNHSLSYSTQNLRQNKPQSPSSILTKSIIQTLQSQLQSIQGYTLTSSSLHSLSHYCDYHSLLKQIIMAKEESRSPKNGYLKEYSKLHSEDSVSKLFNQLVDKDHEMRKNSKMYGQECLFDYFRLKDFSQEKIVASLIRRIVEGKRKGLIEVQEHKKNNKSYYNLECKENRSKLTPHDCKNSQAFQQHKIYYSILALKLLLRETLPNMTQINTTCEEIKVNLQLFLSNLKLKSHSKPLRGHRSSIFRRE